MGKRTPIDIDAAAIALATDRFRTHACQCGTCFAEFLRVAKMELLEKQSWLDKAPSETEALNGRD